MQGYDFTAENPDELTIREGEIIIIDLENEGWFSGTNTRGQSGLFPVRARLPPASPHQPLTVLLGTNSRRTTSKFWSEEKKVVVVDVEDAPRMPASSAPLCEVLPLLRTSIY